MASVTWQCPQCGRRVPNRAEVCHCGMTRRAALAAPAAGAEARGSSSPPPMGEGRAPDLPAAHRFSWRSLPRDIKLLAVGLVLVLVLGIAYLIAVPFRPKPIVPLLGWSEPTSPRKPAPAPTRRPAPPAQKDVRP